MSSASELLYTTRYLLGEYAIASHEVAFWWEGTLMTEKVGGFSEPVDWEDVRDLLNGENKLNGLSDIEKIESVTPLEDVSVPTGSYRQCKAIVDVANTMYSYHCPEGCELFRSTAAIDIRVPPNTTSEDCKKFINLFFSECTEVDVMHIYGDSIEVTDYTPWRKWQRDRPRELGHIVFIALDKWWDGLLYEYSPPPAHVLEEIQKELVNG